MTKPHSRLGSFDLTDFFLFLMIIFVVALFVLDVIGSAHEYSKKKEFYSQNGYVEVKHNGVEIWIKKTDIDLINATPTPEK